MTRLTRTRVAVAVGTTALTLALALVVHAALLGEPATETTRAPSAVAILVVVAGIVLVTWRLRSRPAPEDPSEALPVDSARNLTGDRIGDSTEEQTEESTEAPTRNPIGDRSAERRDGATERRAGAAERDRGRRAAGPTIDGVPADEPIYRRAGRYTLVDPAPERTDADLPLAGRAAADRLSRAASVARAAGSVDAGIESIRPELRSVLVEVLVVGGKPPDEAERIVDEGAWTDDADAAAVLSPAVDPSRRSFRERLRAWLRPAVAARRRLDGAVAAIAAAADGTLPTVPGQRAPRRVEVPPPTLMELRRAVDGSLRPAVDGPARGPKRRGRTDDEGATGAAADASASGAADGPSASDERDHSVADGDGASSGDGDAEPTGDGEPDPSAAADRATGEEWP